MMGECGCGEMQKFKAYKVCDLVLVVETYTGCEYCDTGLMITLHIFTEKEAKAYQIEPVETFEPDKWGHAQLDFPLLGKEDLIKAFDEDTSLRISYGDDLAYLHDYGLEILQRAVYYNAKERER